MTHSKEYNEGYQKGLDGKDHDNPYEIKTIEDAIKREDWQIGYNKGWREFINWVNLMCN